MDETDAPDPSDRRPVREGRHEHRRVAAGRQLRTIEQGRSDAPVAIAFHGLPGSAEDWNRLSDTLAEDFRFVAVDRIGYGKTGGEALSVPEQVAIYTDLIERLARRTGPVLLLGHSYGAVVAASLAARRPDLVGALGLLAPALREERSDRQPPPGTEAIERFLARPAVWSFVKSTILSDVGRGMIARFADPMAFAPDPVDEEHLAGVRDRTLQPEALRSYLAEAKMLSRDAAAVDGQLGTILTPSAVIHARGDRVVRLEAGHRTARSIPRCAMHEIDGGHMLTVSRVGHVTLLLRALAVSAGLLKESAA
ncbi:MAG: alpha/beta hydrolase [Solirubrobacteraceae bacterium]|nr:alpha/beta hydrolase [Solirubrobacteraceae bacterium]